MSRQVCVMLVILAQVGSCIHSSAQIFLAFILPLCGPNVINWPLCLWLVALGKLACMDTYVINLLAVSNSGVVCMMSFIILFLSYVVILYSLRNHSSGGRQKDLSTYTSCLIVVVIFCGPCIFIYTQPPTKFSIDKMVAMFYTIGTRMLKPLIYTPRNGIKK